MAGGFVWTGFDYRGEPTPYGWPCINSHFGIMDTCGFPKDNFYYYQAWWGTKPVLHLFPHWNWPGREGQEIARLVHTNGEQVELFLNGRSLGRQDVKPQHARGVAGALRARHARGPRLPEGQRRGDRHARDHRRVRRGSRSCPTARRSPPTARTCRW